MKKIKMGVCRFGISRRACPLNLPDSFRGGSYAPLESFIPKHTRPYAVYAFICDMLSCNQGDVRPLQEGFCPAEPPSAMLRLATEAQVAIAQVSVV